MPGRGSTESIPLTHFCSFMSSMHLIFELSGDHPDLAHAEALAVLNRSSCDPSLIHQGELWSSFEVSQLPPFPILGMTQAAYQVLEGPFSSPDELLSSLRSDPPSFPDGTFVVRSAHFDDTEIEGSQEFQATVGEVFYDLGRKVSVKDPDIILTVITTKEGTFLSLLVHSRDKEDFMKRHVKNRPFFSPVSLHPKIARAFINVLYRPGETVVDPFCGTGGFLLEAASMDISAWGIDLDPDMVDGSKQNLGHLEYDTTKVLEGDAENISTFLPDLVGKAVIVTDPPYGRSSYTGGQTILELYERCLLAFKDFVGPKGRVGIILPDEASIRQAEAIYELELMVPVRAHRSLTRHLCVFSHRQEGP